MNCINNYYKPGPATDRGLPIVAYRIGEVTGRQPVKTDPTRVWGKWYASGNIMLGNDKITADNWAGGIQFSDSTKSPDAGGDDPTLDAANEKLRALAARVRSDRPFPMPPITVQSAQDAYESVLANAGATLPRRDAVDQRVVTEVRTGITWGMGQSTPIEPPKGLAKNNIGTAGNGIITDISQVGGYPDYKGNPVTYTQNDGIPDWWKQKYGLDLKDPNLASKDCNGDGYTNIRKIPRWDRPGEEKPTGRI